MGQPGIDAIASIYTSWQENGLPQEQGLSAVAIAKERLLAGECRLDVDSWTESGPDISGSPPRVRTTRRSLDEQVSALARIPLLDPLNGRRNAWS